MQKLCKSCDSAVGKLWKSLGQGPIMVLYDKYIRSSSSPSGFSRGLHESKDLLLWAPVGGYRVALLRVDLAFPWQSRRREGSELVRRFSFLRWLFGLFGIHFGLESSYEAGRREEDP